MPWPNLSTHLQDYLILLHVPLPLSLHLRRTLESIHLLCSKIIIDQENRQLHRPSREKALIEGFNGLLRKCAALLRAVNEIPGDVDKRGVLKEKRLRMFGEDCEDVVEIVEGMEVARRGWLEGVRRGQGVKYKEARAKEVERGISKTEEGEVSRVMASCKKDEGEVRRSERRWSTRRDDLWVTQQKFEDEIIRLAGESKVAVWRLLTGEEPAPVAEEKANEEGKDEKAGSDDEMEEPGAEDSGFFEQIDKFLEKNMDEMDPNLKRYSTY